MDNIFGYISTIITIRDAKSTPFISPNTSTFDQLDNIHNRIMTYCYDQAFSSVMVFEKELSLIRDLEDVNNNEIKTFLITNTDWDILILGVNDILVSEPVSGFTRIYKAPEDAQHKHYVYIASRRYMQKVKNGNTESVNIYLYKPTFITNYEIDKSSSSYQVATVTDIYNASSLDIKYRWNALKL